MTRAELREKVARICGGNYIAADAAISVALEEAARMARPPAHMLGSADSYANGYRAACKEIAAAIRALIPKGNDNG